LLASYCCLCQYASVVAAAVDAVDVPFQDVRDRKKLPRMLSMKSGEHAVLRGELSDRSNMMRFAENMVLGAMEQILRRLTRDLKAKLMPELPNAYIWEVQQE
jgi:hypothetical protein